MGKQDTSDSNSNWMGLGCGCLVLALVGIIGLGFFAKAQIGKLVDKEIAPYVADTAVTFPPVEAPEEKIDATIARYNDFVSSTEDNTPIAPLRLSAEDINILIAHHPEYAEIADGGRVQIADGKITADITIELEGVPFFDGKFLNGKAVFTISMVDGEPELFVEELVSNDKVLPQSFLDAFQSENLLADSPDAFGNVESIEVTEDEVIFRAKKSLGESPSPN